MALQGKTGGLSVGQMLLQQHTGLRCNEEQFEGFIAGLEAVLQQWTALLLVAQNHGGLDTLQIMRDELLGWFDEKGEVYVDELEEYFREFFNSDGRFVSVEDGSDREVAEVLHSMYCNCTRGDFALVHQYQRSLVEFRKYDPVGCSRFLGDFAGSASGPEGEPVLLSSRANGEGEEEEEGEGEEVGVGPSGGNAVVAVHEEGSAPPAPAPAEKPKPQQPKTHAKNPFKKSADGWCTVQHRR